jgi:hypothetical protein
MKNIILVAAAMGFSFTGVLSAPRALASERYLIETSHKPEDCVKALDTMAEQDKKLLSKMDWGCLSGDHTGYVIVDAASEQDARAKLPDALRADAKIVKLNKFTPKEIASFHQK